MLSNCSLLKTNFKVISLNHIPLVEMPANIQELDIKNLDVVLDFICENHIDHIIFDYCQTVSIETKALSALNKICEKLNNCCIEVIFWSLTPKTLKQITDLGLIEIVSVDFDTNFVLPLKQNYLLQIIDKILGVFMYKNFRFAK